MKRLVFWLRWSARDLRERWLLVIAIAATIALGTGAFASLESMSAWRQDANTRSLALLNAHDVRLSLAEGSYATPDELAKLVDAIPHRSAVSAAEPRLVLATRVDASTADETIVVPGRIVGMPTASKVDTLDVRGGRAFDPADDDRNVTQLEYHFATHYDLAAGTSVTVADGVRLQTLGSAFSPDYFLVISPLGDVMAEANYAVVFVPIATAGRLSGHPGAANELVLRLSDPALAPVVRDELEAAARSVPSLGAAVTLGADENSRRWVVKDATNDESFFAMFAFLMLAGATFAAFNLTTRIVESQRRQVGIGLALGLPGRTLAIRPLAVAAEIALLGVLLGVVVGLAFGAALRQVLVDMLPMPIFETPLRLEVFAQAAALGFCLPFAASIYPVWRAVRARPVDAIRTGYLAARRPGLARLARRLPLPSTIKHPLSNVLRTPRRTLLTGLGIGAAVTVMVATLGMLDTFDEGMRRGQAEIEGGSPNRIAVDLVGPMPADAIRPELAAVAGVARVDLGLRLPASVKPADAADEPIDLQLDVLDLSDNAWRATVSSGRLPSAPNEILLSEQALQDLGAALGDQVMLRHPVRVSASAVSMADDPVTVVGTHPSPMRPTAYMDVAAGRLFGMEGLTNRASVVPAAGANADALRVELFGLDGVVSSQPTDALVTSMRNVVAQFTDILAVVALFALLLAMLVAYNSATISQDERTREVATMLAFGLPARRVMASAMIESGIVGVVGTLVGLVGGLSALAWLAYVLFPDTMPDFGLDPALSPGTLALALCLGVFAVAAAPLLTWRRLTRMNLPGTLRVVE